MPSSSNEREDLITAIYDAALNPRLWQNCFDQMRALLSAESALATLQDPASGSAALVACNMDAAFIQQYADGWWQKDIWAHGGIRHQRGRAFIVSELVSDAEWMRSEIYNELVKPLADCRHCLGSIVDVGSSLGVMGLHRPAMASDFTEAERRQFQGLVPHIQRALRIGQKLERQDLAQRTALAAIDALSFGIIVVDAAGRALLMNRVAEACFRPGGGLTGGRSSRPVRAEAVNETAMLQRQVRSAASGRPDGGGALQISRKPPLAPLMLQISPLVGQQAAVLGVVKPAALILIEDPDQGAAPPHRIMRDLFGLTAAETELAGHLALGTRLEDIAEQRGVKISTLRTHLKSLLAKTDTDRQVSLVRLLTRLSVRDLNE